MKFNLKNFITGIIIGLLLISLSSELINYSYADWNQQPPSFPSCQNVPSNATLTFQANGEHQIVGGSLLYGNDKVYYLPNGNTLQCYCPNFNPGSQGIQTDWWKTALISLFGWIDQNGTVWGLGNTNFLAQNSNFSCNVPTPTNTPVMPTPIASSSATPTSTSTPTSNSSSNSGGGSGGGGSSLPGSTTNAPGAATCNISFASPILQGWSWGALPGSMTFNWWRSTAQGITSQSIQYGYSPNNLPYGVPNLPAGSSSVTLNDLTPGAHVWAVVWAWKGGCAERSNLFDPVAKR